MARRANVVKADVTLRLKREYLEALAKSGIITAAAYAAGVSRQTVYRWIEDDPDFRQRHEEAIIASTEMMEQEAWRRATEGVERVIYYKGEPVGAIREHSDSLLMFMLKARKPTTYRERLDVNTKVQAQIDVSPSDMVALLLEHLTDDDLDRAAAAILIEPGPG